MDENITINSERYVIRPYRADDEAPVLSLWQTVFGKEISRDYWRWKYINNPYGHRILLCVKDTGEVVVLYGGIPYPAEMEGRLVEVIQLMDIMSHPDYRKTGLFIKTVEAFIKRFAGPQKAVLFYGFPGKYHYEIGHKYLAYNELSGGVRFLSGSTRDLSKNNRLRGGRLIWCSDIDAAGDRVWSDCRKFYPFSVIRDRRFLKWRFLMNPKRSYEIFGYASGAESHITGYAVFAHDHDTVMVDLLMPHSDSMLRDFMAAVSDNFIRRGMDKVVTWLPANHFLTNALISSGFSVSEEPLGFIPTARSFAPFLPWDWASQNMYYSMADADLI